MNATVSAPGPTQDVRPVRRALVSVYDKTGLEELVRGLADASVELVSTGGSAALIAGLGLPVTTVEDLTGFPECLEGRVKTLHPRVHAGILADTRKLDHLAQLADLGVAAFELVVVNLYPFAATVASGATPDECVEQIDIGGPSMVRAAAKNHPSVAVLTNPSQYAAALAAVRSGGFTFAARQRLAAEAFAHTAAYDVAVASWMGSGTYADTSDGTGFAAFAGATYTRAAGLRYGENPHQRAALYLSGAPGIASVAFGGVIAVNRTVTLEMAQTVKDIFTEVVVAPGYDDDALAVLTAKKNIRLLTVDFAALDAAGTAGTAGTAGSASGIGQLESRPVSGGLLVQSVDRVDAIVRDDAGTATGGDDPAYWQLACGDPADEVTLADLAFAWRAVRAVKSNAILLARDGASVGIGMGQVNRVDSCRLAVSRAGEDRARGSVAASDAFFPFADGPQILIDAGVRAIVQPGGSMRDAETVAAATAAGVTMYFTGTRHFAH
ncbi:MAG: bifunctional phosphoribosylaminoimidazolecarboxamide formyltransferase/IMP cyclohydrolase [Actinomycetales bacterium]|nr:bifunctional phosphoribosylaminoimidazolecarboxamide formyltransferase/IMP cyclohydrolase [Candidatus Phosphoribacter baldrii]